MIGKGKSLNEKVIFAFYYLDVDKIAVFVNRKFGQPLIQSFSKGRKASLLIFSTIVGVSDTDTGIDPCFVDVMSTAVKF